MANSTSGFLRRKEELLEFLGGIDYDARCAALMSAAEEGKALSAVEELKALEGKISEMLERRVHVPYLDNKIEVHLAKVSSLKRSFLEKVSSELIHSRNSFEQLYSNVNRKDPNLQKSIAELRKLSESAIVLEDLVGQSTPLVRSYASYSSDLKAVDQQFEQSREAYVNEQIAPEEVIKKAAELEVSYEKVNADHQPNVFFKHPAYKYSNSLLTRLKREVALHKRRNLPKIREQIRQDVLEMTGVMQNLGVSGEEYFAVLQRVQNLQVSKEKYKRWRKFSFLAKDVASYKAAFEDYFSSLEQHAQAQLRALSEDIAGISAGNFDRPSEGLSYIIKFKQGAKKALAVLSAFDQRAHEVSEQLSVLDVVVSELQSSAQARGEKVLGDYSFSFVETISDAHLPSSHPLQEMRAALVGDTHNGSLPDRILHTKRFLDQSMFGDNSGRQFLEKYRSALVSSMNQGYLAYAFDNNLVSRDSFNEVIELLDSRITEMSK